MMYYLGHVLRLKPVATPDTLRQGTNWHRAVEILTMTPGILCECVWGDKDPYSKPVSDCLICGGSGYVPDDLREALIRSLNAAYAECPASVELSAWETERTIILYSALGWQWHWGNDQVETVAREVGFDRQVNSRYRRRGRIDRIIRRGGQVLLGEYKSTSKPIDSGSLYWDRLRLDSQLTLYLIEARHLQLAGELEQYGLSATDPLIFGMLYDVWHKPTIRPKKLSQADTKKFVATKEYFGETFDLDTPPIVSVEGELHEDVLPVNQAATEVTWGAKPKKEGATRPFAIRETPEMFGARLLADIQANPEKHFARKEIARTDRDLRDMDEEFENIFRLTNISVHRDLWFRNENQCDATYRCSFHSICYYNLDVTDGNVPDGFCKKEN